MFAKRAIKLKRVVPSYLPQQGTYTSLFFIWGRKKSSKKTGQSNQKLKFYAENNLLLTAKKLNTSFFNKRFLCISLTNTLKTFINIF